MESQASEMKRLDRYRRQAALPEIGPDGQARLRDAVVLVAGCGALGSHAIDMLARAGVGELVLVDRDIVEESNLQRQVLFDEADAAAAAAKVEAARDRVARVNSAVKVHAIAADINATNIESIALATATRRPHVIVDALDNFEARMVLNDLSIKHGIPLIYGGAVSTFGSVYVVLPPGAEQPWAGTPSRCLRCLFGQLPAAGLSPSCDTAGVLGPLVAIIAAMQVIEAMKVLLQDWSAIERRWRMLDCWHHFERAIPVDGDTGVPCPCCAGRTFDHLETRAGSQTAWLCGNGAIQVALPAHDPLPDLAQLAMGLPTSARVRVSEFVLRCFWPVGSREADITLFRDGRAIVRGVDSLHDARHAYQQLLGR